MELTKKTTILFSPALHAHLVGLAGRRGVSLGELVREACERQYGFVPVEQRMEALRQIASLELPVDTPARMKEESVPTPENLLP